MKIEVIPNILSVENCYNLLTELDPVNTATSMAYFDTASDNGIKKLKVDNSIANDILDKLSIERDKLESISLVYYPTGSQNTPHCDNCQVDIIDNVKTVKRFKPWNHTGIIFLNNNFTGGELVYLNQGCVFLPTVGTMIIAPAGEDYIHFVNPILTGERFTLVFRFL
jgi:hypothetical protein